MCIRDSADPEHPAKMRFYIPSGLVRINRMQLSWELSAFRAYETGAAAGGSTTQTSSSGGGSTATSSSSEDVACTSESGGETTVSQPVRVLSSDGGGTAIAIGNFANIDGTGYSTAANTAGLTTDDAGKHKHTIGHTHDIAAHKHTCFKHAHTINSHSHDFSGSQSLAWGHQHSYGSIGDKVNTGGVVGYKPKDISISGTTGGRTLTANEAGDGDSSSVALMTGGTSNQNSGESGSHNHTIPAHTHKFQHAHKVEFSINVPGFTVDIPAHTHNVKIPGHNHRVSISAHTHELTLPDHTHDITYGIFEGTTARSVRLLVDGTEVPSEAISKRELDISAYLEKDEDGKITRSAWHTVELVPDKLTRIEANLFAQTFIQSTGGGDY